MNYVLDLDDTLYPEISWRMSAFKFLADYFNIPELYFFLIKNQNKPTCFIDMIDRYTIKTSVTDLIRLMKTHDPTISLPKESKIFLEKHKKDNLFLVTNGCAKMQVAKIKALDIAHYFKSIQVCDWYGKSYWKPAPFVYNVLVDHFDLKKEDTIVIGDNPKSDFLIPQLYGWKCYRLLQGNFKDLHLNYPYDCKNKVTSILSI